jgi:hypothetical protein
VYKEIGKGLAKPAVLGRNPVISQAVEGDEKYQEKMSKSFFSRIGEPTFLL